MKITIWVIGIFMALLGFLLVSALVTDFYYFRQVSGAKTPSEIKAACNVDWYASGTLKKLPAKCLQFYPFSNLTN